MFHANCAATPSGLPSLSVPDHLSATGPCERFGRPRDHVRLMVASESGPILHSRFFRLSRFLRSGDVLVANDSATLPAALRGAWGGRQVRVHISTPLDGSTLRSIELRWPDGVGSRRCGEGTPGSVIDLAGGGSVRLVERLGTARPPRLWAASLDLPGGLDRFLADHGAPIRYSYVRERWPLEDYQTFFARVPGSSEMPSAARPFTPNVCAALERCGVGIATVTLHTGVGSLDADELPYAEPFVVPPAAARAINEARAKGGRAIAVGTTAMRAIESAAALDGHVHSATGFANLVVDSSYSVRATDGLLTGWHDPSATHLQMLQSLLSTPVLERCYIEAIARGYRWHEFGDSHLILRGE